MIVNFKIGDELSFSKIVENTDIAAFNGQMVHPVYSTFALGRDAEWTCRQFVLKMKEDHEEGIGTFLNIKHQSPALLNQKVTFTAKLIEIHKNDIICSFIAKVNDRIIAQGEQGQKILNKQKIAEIFKAANI